MTQKTIKRHKTGVEKDFNMSQKRVKYELEDCETFQKMTS